MKIYTKILAGLYAVGAFLHLLDLLDLRLEFSTMNPTWKSWIIFLFMADTLAAVGLWKQKIWGQQLFILVALSQLTAYTVFNTIFGLQVELIIFHVATLAIYITLLPKHRTNPL